MQPEQQPAAEPPYPGDASAPGGVSSGRSLPKLYRGRPWLAAVVGALVELVVIAAVDNQAVTKILRDPLDDKTRVIADYSRGAIDAATVFWWRAAPADGQATHVWAAQFAAIGVLVLLAWLGTLTVARGSVTFGRVWVGVWAVIAISTPIAMMVRNALVIPSAPGLGQSKLGQAIYGHTGLGFGAAIVAGLALGFVTGLIVAAVSVSSRRQVAAAAVVGRGYGERDEYYDDSFAPRYDQAGQGQPQYGQPGFEPRPWNESQWQTTQLPPVAPETPPTWPPAAAEQTVTAGRPAAAEQTVTAEQAAEQAAESRPTEPPWPAPDAFERPVVGGWPEPTAQQPAAPPEAERHSPVAEPAEPAGREAAPPTVEQQPRPEPDAPPSPSEQTPSEASAADPSPGEQTRQLPRIPADPAAGDR